MIVTISSINTVVNVKEYSVDYESSIIWKTVGSKHKGIDRGLNADKISSEITIRNKGITIAALRAQILSASNSGSSIFIKCEPFETVFGPEFDYGNYTYECVIEQDEDSYDTDSLNTSAFTEWTFTAYPKCNMSERYLRDSGMFPSTLSMISAKRIDNGARVLANADTSRNIIGFGFSAPTCEIEYEGTLEEVAEAKSFLQKLRTNYFQFSASLVWPFNLGVTNVNVYCLDIDDNGPLDKTSQWHSFTVVYGYAGAAIPVWDGVTVTTPALVDGYYQIYDGATLVGFNALAVANKKAKVVADFALNDGWENYNAWLTTPPSNSMPAHSTSSGLEFDGGSHTIYGLLTDVGLAKCTVFHHIKIHGALFTGSSGIFNGIGLSSNAYCCQIVGNLKSTVQAGFFGYRFYQASAHDLAVYGSIISVGSFGLFFGTAYEITVKNSCVVGNLTTYSSFNYRGGFWGYNDSTAKAINNCFESLTFDSGGTVNAFGYNATTITNSYYDSDKIGSANPQGLAKTTAEMKSPAFVDLLNAHVPSGSLNWKLETVGLLAGWPVHDF